MKCNGKIRKLSKLYAMKVPEGMNIPRVAPFVNRQVDKILNAIIEKMAPSQWMLNTENRKERIVVSLTSFPARISVVSKTVLTILNQTVKPDRVVLWLARNQFPDQVLPESLVHLTEFGLEIKFCEEDLFGHKKYYYTMQEEPDSFIITVDDDLIYPENMIERLLEKHELFPDAVISLRGKEIMFSDGRLITYNKWPTLSREGVLAPSDKIMASTGAGALYPPHAVPKEVFNMSAIMECALYTDDLWMKVMEMLVGTKVMKISYRTRPFAMVSGSQNECLNVINDLGGNNDVCLEKLMNRYPQIKEILNDMGREP